MEPIHDDVTLKMLDDKLNAIMPALIHILENEKVLLAFSSGILSLILQALASKSLEDSRSIINKVIENTLGKDKLDEFNTKTFRPEDL